MLRLCVRVREEEREGNRQTESGEKERKRGRVGGRGEKEREKKDACIQTHTDVFFSCVLGAYWYRLCGGNLLLRMKNRLCVRARARAFW
jgi:hypothetical protein